MSGLDEAGYSRSCRCATAAVARFGRFISPDGKLTQITNDDAGFLNTASPSAKTDQCSLPSAITCERTGMDDLLKWVGGKKAAVRIGSGRCINSTIESRCRLAIQTNIPIAACGNDAKGAFAVPSFCMAKLSIYATS